MESGGEVEVAVVEEEVESLGDVFGASPGAEGLGTFGDERGECVEVTEEGGIEESGGGKDDTIVGVLKDLSAEGVEEVLLLGLAKERVARAGVEGSGGERDVW